MERLLPSEKFVYSYLEVLAAKECTRLVEQVFLTKGKKGTAESTRLDTVQSSHAC